MIALFRDSPLSKVNLLDSQIQKWNVLNLQGYPTRGRKRGNPSQFTRLSNLKRNILQVFNIHHILIER